jgi:hypothetical protein
MSDSLGTRAHAPLLSVKLTTIAEISEIKLLSISVNVLAASGDVLITVILCTLFQQARTGFRASDTMLNKLIMFSISTGLLTSICAVMCLICVCDRSQVAPVGLLI